MIDTCAFKPFHDLAENRPFGPSCGKPATHHIVWKDGRYSPMCPEHGLEALDPDARSLVERVIQIKEGGARG